MRKFCEFFASTLRLFVFSCFTVCHSKSETQVYDSFLLSVNPERIQFGGTTAGANGYIQGVITNPDTIAKLLRLFTHLSHAKYPLLGKFTSSYELNLKMVAKDGKEENIYIIADSAVLLQNKHYYLEYDTDEFKRILQIILAASEKNR